MQTRFNVSDAQLNDVLLFIVCLKELSVGVVIGIMNVDGCNVVVVEII